MDTQIMERNGGCKMLAELAGHNMVVGTKQLRKALASGKAIYVFLAENADPAITKPIETMCRTKNVDYAWIRTMLELGQACGIEVGAAAAAAVE